jgi:hypothetical protein
MPLRRALAAKPIRHPARRALGAIPLILAVSALVFFFAQACGDSAPKAPVAQGPSPAAASGVFTVYASPDCGCCAVHADYLQEEGFQVDVVPMQDVTEMKVSLGIPEEMWGCHTTVVGEYFIEGHVPVEAIHKLLEERPDIDGIAMPGMPAGSPGMGGVKAEPFVIYAIAGGEVNEFTRI